MNKIIFLHGIKLVKFLVDCGLKVYFENKNYRVIKDRFDNYIIYCSKTEFSGGKIELYNNDFKEDKFFTLIQEIDSSLTKGKIIGLFHNEMYEEENLNEMNNNTLLEAVYSDEEYCTFYDCFDSFLSNLEFFEDEIINNEYCFRLIITDKDIAKLTCKSSSLNSFILGTNPQVDTVICLAPIARPFASFIIFINFIILS